MQKSSRNSGILQIKLYIELGELSPQGAVQKARDEEEIFWPRITERGVAVYPIVPVYLHELPEFISRRMRDKHPGLWAEWLVLEGPLPCLS